MPVRLPNTRHTLRFTERHNSKCNTNSSNHEALRFHHEARQGCTEARGRHHEVLWRRFRVVRHVLCSLRLDPAWLLMGQVQRLEVHFLEPVPVRLLGNGVQAAKWKLCRARQLLSRLLPSASTCQHAARAISLLGQRLQRPADQQLTQNQLKTMITDAITNNLLWTKNWAAEPLPRLVGDGPTARPNVVSAPPMPPPPRPFAPPLQPFRPPPVPQSASFIPFNNAPKGQKRKSDAAGGLAMSQEDMKKKNQRRQRFLKEQTEMGRSVTPTVDSSQLRVLTSDGELDLEAMTIKGTSQVVEKEYLRLTSAPHPSTVRPEPVLHQALEMVKSKWKKGACDYVYACSQLKSIRQDCTVQRIKNEFTVRVYETHARVALESGDINEFNQCQTQLHELYEKSIPGKAIEFLSYRILYCIYVTLQAKKIDSNAGQLGMYSVLANVTSAVRENDSIRHALDVREAVASNNYHRFFQLYMDAPNMAGYLMDSMVPTIRLRALRAICKAYRPNVPIDFIRQELRLEGKEGDEFISQSGLAFVSGSKGELVDTKNSDVVWVLSDQSSLI
ncbi:hypothetical protein P43SY_008624 [Pythium insidiosum]|uniref:PCI domain-containing protein n=1 Tax=Pythium insidiosum TaxID=114742 RepID=A0AAD5L905_PYTIN|nr:hypothetical protein P43SY_008624 [Pythium insidiosum]